MSSNIRSQAVILLEQVSCMSKRLREKYALKKKDNACKLKLWLLSRRFSKDNESMQKI